jgi:galactokinase
MAWALQETGQRLQGWDGLLASDIPVASGLSSSAAIELATARAFWALSHWGWDGIEMARTARKMENEWLGLRSGIMDQMISACGRENHALLIDCRDLTSEPVPHPEGLTIVVMDTAVRRGLVDSAYNQRVEQCRAAAKHLGIISLREASSELLAARSLGLDEILLRRARHVVSENERTLQAAAAMRDGKTTTLGRLMDASHNSLRDDYEVSCPELDSMVEIARSQEGCLGARMTGAGFGGCAVALVQSANVDEFCGRVHKGYRRTTGRIPNIFACQPSAGAALVSEREP